MKKTTTLLLAIVFSFCAIAQNKNVGFELMTGSKLVSNNFDVPSTEKSVSKILQYGEGIMNTGLGSIVEHTIGGFNTFTSEDMADYSGQNVTHIRVAFESVSHITNGAIQLFDAGVTADPVYTQDLNLSELKEGWNLIKLSTPYEIPADKSFSYGVLYDAGEGFGIVTDVGPNASENSGLTFYFGMWFTLPQLAIDGNYCLQALITDGNGVRDLAITSVKPTTETGLLSSEEVLKVTVANIGDVALSDSLKLSVTIYDVAYTTTVSPTTMGVGEEMVVDMPAIDLSTPDVYELTAAFENTDDITANNGYATLLSTGDATITVDLLTDKMPLETSWEIVDEAGNLYAKNGSLGITERTITDVSLPSTGCYKWIIYDTGANGLEGTIYPGAYSISYNDAEKFKSGEDVDFGSMLESYNLGGGCAANDVYLMETELPSFMNPGTLVFNGKIMNLGQDNLTSFTVYCKVNDDSVAQVFTGVDISLGEVYEFEFTRGYIFSTENEYSIEMVVVNPNDGVDENTDDNMLETDLIVFTGYEHKYTLVEKIYRIHQTGPATENAIQELIAGGYNLAVINYHNGDNFSNTPSEARAIYYDIESLPFAVFDGVNSYIGGGNSSSSVASEYEPLILAREGVTTPISLALSDVIYDQDTVWATASCSALFGISDELVMHIALVENNIDTAWFGMETANYVERNMINSGLGVDLDLSSAEISNVVEFGFPIDSTWNPKNCELVAFVQHRESYEVLQCDKADVIGASTLTFNLDLTEYSPLVPETDEIEVYGSFDEYPLALTDADADGVYTGSIESLIGTTITYEYLINGITKSDTLSVKLEKAEEVVNDKIVQVGVSESEFNKVACQPNPFNNELMIKNIPAGSTITVTNVVGQTQQVIENTNESLMLDTEDYENGIYLISISNNGNQKMLKVVKQ